MEAEVLLSTLDTEQLFDRIADALTEKGYVVLPASLPIAMSDALFARIASFEDDVFRPAGVGRAGEFQLNPFVRNDEIRWLTPTDEIEASYLAWMEKLRTGLNRRLFMGLFDYECHFARYAPGAFYKKHVDAFKGRTNRVLSTVFYLNPNWALADGGHLVMYEESLEPIAKISPLMGTLVVFLSDRFPHEVTIASRLRYSIAGWFRVNTTLGPHIDPPQ
ncbi:2OG-Fe(II) oxygenase [Zhongshania sp. BJYM1]|uniref:2OG-Fe(II) oxygenase n=1 Tax=Zhongshania aquatica TaxID=2965069 RepID=UPI0022B362F8|nr:2OG-Fe(II) oxygenase [Marortus sp. BJYM1]